MFEGYAIHVGGDKRQMGALTLDEQQIHLDAQFSDGVDQQGKRAFYATLAGKRNEDCEMRS